VTKVFCVFHWRFVHKSVVWSLYHCLRINNQGSTILVCLVFIINALQHKNWRSGPTVCLKVSGLTGPMNLQSSNLCLNIYQSVPDSWDVFSLLFSCSWSMHVWVYIRVTAVLEYIWVSFYHSKSCSVCTHCTVCPVPLRGTSILSNDIKIRFSRKVKLIPRYISLHEEEQPKRKYKIAEGTHLLEPRVAHPISERWLFGGHTLLFFGF